MSSLSASASKLTNILVVDETIDPLEIVEHVPIVLSTKSGDEMYIVSIRRMTSDNTSTGQIIHEKFHATAWKRFWNAAIFRKQGIFIGTVQMLQPLDLQIGIDHPYNVRIRDIEPFPCKDLEKVFSDPSVGATWSPYAIVLDDPENTPVVVRALIIKWRPTKKRTKKIMKTLASWLVSIGVSIIVGEAHTAIAGNGLLAAGIVQ